MVIDCNENVCQNDVEARNDNRRVDATGNWLLEPTFYLCLLFLYFNIQFRTEKPIQRVLDPWMSSQRSFCFLSTNTFQSTRAYQRFWFRKWQHKSLTAPRTLSTAINRNWNSTDRISNSEWNSGEGWLGKVSALESEKNNFEHKNVHEPESFNLKFSMNENKTIDWSVATRQSRSKFSQPAMRAKPNKN